MLIGVAVMEHTVTSLVSPQIAYLIGTATWTQLIPVILRITAYRIVFVTDLLLIIIP